jgi:hypothetical protein
MHANPVNHYNYEGAIIHVHPIATTNKFIRSVSHERTIGFNAKVGFSGHDISPLTHQEELRGGPALPDRMAAWLRWILGWITPPISPRLPG